MVTFVCDNCDQTLKKKQIERHLYQCRGAPRLVCIDCNKVFSGNEHKAHTSCITEQEKTMGQYYKAKKKPQNGQNPTEKSGQSLNVPPKSEMTAISANGKEKGEEKPKESWLGWKKTIRKTLQKQADYKMKIAKLKGLVLKEYLQSSGGVEKESESIFNEKIKNFRFQINGDTIKYIPKKIRTGLNH